MGHARARTHTHTHTHARTHAHAHSLRAGKTTLLSSLWELDVPLFVPSETDAELRTTTAHQVVRALPAALLCAWLRNRIEQPHGALTPRSARR